MTALVAALQRAFHVVGESCAAHLRRPWQIHLLVATHLALPWVVLVTILSINQPRADAIIAIALLAFVGELLLLPIWAGLAPGGDGRIVGRVVLGFAYGFGVLLSSWYAVMLLDSLVHVILVPDLASCLVLAINLASCVRTHTGVLIYPLAALPFFALAAIVFGRLRDLAVQPRRIDDRQMRRSLVGFRFSLAHIMGVTLLFAAMLGMARLTAAVVQPFDVSCYQLVQVQSPPAEETISDASGTGDNGVSPTPRSMPEIELVPDDQSPRDPVVLASATEAATPGDTVTAPGPRFVLQCATNRAIGMDHTPIPQLVAGILAGPILVFAGLTACLISLAYATLGTAPWWVRVGLAALGFFLRATCLSVLFFLPEDFYEYIDYLLFAQDSGLGMVAIVDAAVIGSLLLARSAGYRLVPRRLLPRLAATSAA